MLSSRARTKSGLRGFMGERRGVQVRISEGIEPLVVESRIRR